MAEPFKLLLNERNVRALARQLSHHSGGRFDADAFLQAALPGLDALEMKARAEHVADALERGVSADFAIGVGWMEDALGPVQDPDDDRVLPERDLDEGLGGWILWPVTTWVARHGRSDPGRALPALREMTRRFTAEWAVRPFLVQDLSGTLAWLAGQMDHPCAHVRRWVSEGSRPRLPWGLQLRALIADPSPTLPLLERLQDDPSAYVRRSVANHLNDIAKDHPDRVGQWLERHLPQAPEARRAMLRHASRTLIKQGDARVLACWGLGQGLEGAATLRVAPSAIRLGESVEMTVELRSLSRSVQALEIDYVVHHVGAAGQGRPKVFKGWRLSLAPGELRVLTRRHAVKPVTTRRYYPGPHGVELQVNGQRVADAVFELLDGTAV